MIIKLLASGYNYVIFAEVDEFVIPSPSIYPFGLQDYVKKMKHPTMRATGYNLFHDYLTDPNSIDLNKSILSQRNKWYYDENYSKHVITSIPSLRWSAGFHTLLNEEYKDMLSDPNLYLLHLKKFDYKYYINRGHWKAIQNFNMYEFNNYAYSHSAHAVGKMLQYTFWRLNCDTIDIICVYQNKHCIDIAIEEMYTMLEIIPMDLIHPHYII